MADLSARTALPRSKPSAPVRFLIESNVFAGRCLDWGCGLSVDQFYIASQPNVKSCDAYDKHHWPTRPSGVYDVIYCGYVANTLRPVRRRGLYMDMLQFMDYTTTAYIVVRSDKIDGEPSDDGVVTSRGTFQKSYSPDVLTWELMEFFNVWGVIRKGHYLIAEVSK